MSIVLTNLRGSFNKRIEQRFSDQDGIEQQGTLTNVQGLLTGQSLNSNGNRAYVGLGSAISVNGSVTYTNVVNARFKSPTINVNVGSQVLVKYSRARKTWFIEGMDAERIEQSGASIQRYNMANVNNRFIDAGFILNFLSQPLIARNDDTRLEIKPGWYLYNGQWRVYNGGQFDMASYVTSNGMHKLVQLWHKPDTNTITATSSTEQSTSTAFDSTDENEVLTSADNWMPLGMWIARDDTDTRVNWGNFYRDNRPIYNIPSGTNASYLATRYEPLTNGDVSSPELLFMDGDVIMMEVAT